MATINFYEKGQAPDLGFTGNMILVPPFLSGIYIPGGLVIKSFSGNEIHLLYFPQGIEVTETMVTLRGELLSDTHDLSELVEALGQWAQFSAMGLGKSNSPVPLIFWQKCRYSGISVSSFRVVLKTT